MIFLTRWLVLFGLVALTWNPQVWNVIDWAAANWATHPWPVGLVGTALGLVHLYVLVATLRGIGVFGVLLLAASIGTLFWVLWEKQILGLGDATGNAWLGLAVLAFVLAFGLSWRRFQRRAATQANMAAGHPPGPPTGD